MSVEKDGTLYSLARTSKDYRLANEFLKRNNVLYCGTLSFPTILAKRGPEIVGVMGTNPTDKAVIAEPIFAHIRGANPSFILMNLVKAYEGVLTTAGIKRYLFCFEKGDKWIAIIDKLSPEYERLGIDDTNGDIWYRRDL